MHNLLMKIPKIIIQIYFLTDLLYIRVSNFHKACDSVLEHYLTAELS